MKILRYPEKENWQKLLQRPVFDYRALEDKVQAIIDHVSCNGDQALKALTLKYDAVDLDTLEVDAEEIHAAEKLVSDDLKRAIEIAQRNIKTFHEKQIYPIERIVTTSGVHCWQKPVPIKKVGLYIPGGSAPLLSTVLMLGIPANIAGCSEVILCTPPDKEGKVHNAILYIAGLLSITKVFCVGGVQAIAAMAFGTESIPAVNKIFGPGNKYVTMAKQIVSREKVAIDLPAGPSELAVVADTTSNPAFIASDLLSQAEHGPDSQVLLVTDSGGIIGQVQAEIKAQLASLPRKDIVTEALNNSKMVLLKDQKEVMDLINMYAPEHLILATENCRDLADRVINAGSVFLGEYTPESAGDYASGTNHTLPTNGWAHAYSGVNMDSFYKKITFQEISEYGLNNIGDSIMTLAEAEKLQAHRNAVAIRLKSIRNG